MRVPDDFDVYCYLVILFTILSALSFFGVQRYEKKL